MITRDQAIIGSDDDRKSYNRNLTIPHAKLEAALSSIEDQVTTESGYPITILVGPTGAGKSSLGRYWVRKVIENFAKKSRKIHRLYQWRWSRLMLREKSMRLTSASSSLESRMDFCLQVLSMGLRSPGEVSEPYDIEKASQLMMERAIKERDLRYLVLDDVIHFINSTTPVIYYGNFLKSLSNRSGFNSLLPGAYGSEEIIHASGQLARRIKNNPPPSL